MTLMTMATAGAMVKTPAVTMVLRSFCWSMPISLLRRTARTRKKTDCSSTARMMIPASTNRMGLLTEKFTHCHSFCRDLAGAYRSGGGLPGRAGPTVSVERSL